MKKFCFVVLGALFLVGGSRAQERAPVLEKIAKAYGLDSWGQIETIRYTWNASFGPVSISHSWEWEPKTGKVTFEGKDKDGKPVKVTYLRSQLSTQPDTVKNETDPAFNNDNYWLIFPFHAYWDTSADVKDEGKQKLPLGKGTADKVVVKYPPEVGGYTPGDTWTLFAGPDCRVEEFTYHRGGEKKPTEVITTWAGYKKAGPLLISTDHRGTADGKPVRIFFTNVAVKLTGSDTWLDAK